MSMIMSKQNFYSLINTNGVIGVKKQDGYQVKLDDITINIYEEFYKSQIYFIDPDTGLSLQRVKSVNGIEDIEHDLECFIEKSREILEKIKKTKEYSLQKKVFRKYKEARLFNEKYKVTIQDIERKG